MLWATLKFRIAVRANINLFEDANFTEFCAVLDGNLKQLNRTGEEKAGVITVEMEKKLWQSWWIAR